jgi:hypothetical protein
VILSAIDLFSVGKQHGLPYIFYRRNANVVFYLYADGRGKSMMGRTVSRIIFSKVICTILALFFGISLAVPSTAKAAHNDYTPDDLFSIIEGIVNWKKVDYGSAAHDGLMNSGFLANAGTSAVDWYAIALGRLGYADDYNGYLAVLKEHVTERYSTSEKLDANKATEWHRIGLAVLSAGGDPTAFGVDPHGQPVDLVADGSYNRDPDTPLDNQGLNGYIFGLLLMDALRYKIPPGAQNTRDDIIAALLAAQSADGGFSLIGGESAADLTAMAIQALAPYYNSQQTYPAGENQKAGTVRKAIDEALAYLSAQQLVDGDFGSFDNAGSEATAQVIIALCSLGIDPVNDVRFIKNNNNLLDGLIKYRQADGGFIHSFTHDADNPAS